MSQMSKRDSKLILNSASQHFDQVDMDAYSSGTNGRLKSIVELLNDRVAAFASNNFASEFGKLTIENDMVTTFFDEIDKLSDQMAFAFIESLK